MWLTSCSSEDPSVAAEREKELSEAMTRLGRLEVELEQSRAQAEELRSQLEESTAAIEGAKSLAMPTPEEVRSKFVEAALEWESKVKDSNPAFQVALRSFAEPQGPSMDYPFVCSGTFTLRGPMGELKDVFWKAKGNPAGEWIFTETSLPHEDIAVVRRDGESQSRTSSQEEGPDGRSGELSNVESNEPERSPTDAKIDQRIREAKARGERIIDTRDPSRAVMGPGSR
ncbi:hypothetical protein [Haloferula sp. A504]|uniref:hypothetical protein n=1 Tax=Haloferula sp. A504 TaxID=3373601 RepID=UPI0037C19436